MHRLSRLYSLSAAGLFAAALLASTAKADTIHFALTDGTNNISFDIQTSAGTLIGSPLSYDSNTSSFNVSTIVDGATAATDKVSFYDSFYGGGLVLRSAANAIVLSQTAYPSATLFTGATSSPTFKLGTFSLTDDGGAQFTNNFSITISDLTPPPPPPPPPPVTAVTLEPSSFLLLATGLLGGAGAIKRRVA